MILKIKQFPFWRSQALSRRLEVLGNDRLREWLAQGTLQLYLTSHAGVFDGRFLQFDRGRSSEPAANSWPPASFSTTA